MSIVESINKDKYQLVVVFPSQFSTVQDKLNFLGVKNYPLKIKKYIWSLKSILKFIEIVKTEQTDLIHVHSQEASFLVRFISKIFLGKKIVYTPQTIDIRKKKLFFFYKSFEVLFSIITDKIISVNQYDSRRMIKWGINTQKIKTVYNSIDIEKITKKVYRSNEINNHSPVVLQIGRLSEQKSPLNFILGAELVLKIEKNVSFWMVGDGPLYKDIISSIENKGLQGFIKVFGNKEDVYNYILRADIITLTSKWEGMPYSLIEAMAFKKPIVSTNVNGCSELIYNGKNGFLVNYNDLESWAKKVVYLLQNPDLAKKFGEEGFRLVNEKFSLQKMIVDIEKIYYEVINK
jgi:glycosyltransferase involved in cell wall biosynthesis